MIVYIIYSIYNMIIKFKIDAMLRSHQYLEIIDSNKKC